MKNVIVLLVFFLSLPFSLFAQEENEIIPVDWKEVKKVAEKDPQRIKDLVTRMASSEIDTTMTWKERVLAYYGQSFLTPFIDYTEGRKLDDLLREGKYEDCLAGAKQLLQQNPVSLKALSNAALAISVMLKDSIQHDGVTFDEGQEYYSRMFLILSTIDHTGDGTEKKPFCVTMVSDEYMFMRYYLDIWEVESQFLTNSMCDGFNLKETNENYSRKQIFFDVSRVLELEKEMFRE